MVSRGFRKRGCAVSTITRVKSPITLAAEMLKRGNEPDAGGAQGHVHISGAECERLAGEWGVELCDPSWFWTRKRWEQHQGGGEGIEPPPKDDDDDRVSDRVKDGNRRPDGTPWPTDDPAWDGKEYIPKGTVGCVVLDATGTLAVATSTGGLTNKLPGRIGDTPTFGAGFWAEEWLDSASVSAPAYASASAPASAGPPLSTPVLKELGVAVQSYIPNAAPLASLLTQAQHHLAKTKIIDTFRNCFSSSSTTSSSYAGSSCTQHDDHPPTVYYPNEKPHPKPQPHAVALGGTGKLDLSYSRLLKQTTQTNTLTLLPLHQATATPFSGSPPPAPSPPLSNSATIPRPPFNKPLAGWPIPTGNSSNQRALVGVARKAKAKAASLGSRWWMEKAEFVGVLIGRCGGLGWMRGTRGGVWCLRRSIDRMDSLFDADFELFLLVLSCSCCCKTLVSIIIPSAAPRTPA